MIRRVGLRKLHKLFDQLTARYAGPRALGWLVLQDGDLRDGSPHLVDHRPWKYLTKRSRVTSNTTLELVPPNPRVARSKI